MVQDEFNPQQGAMESKSKDGKECQQATHLEVSRTRNGKGGRRPRVPPMPAIQRFNQL